MAPDERGRFGLSDIPGPRGGVVILTNDMAIKGGTNRVIVDLIWSLAPQMHITLITLDAGPSAYAYPPTVPVVTVKGLRFLSWRRALRTVRSLLVVPSLTRVFRRVDPQIVMSFLPRANIANILAKAVSGLAYRTIVCERNYNIAQYQRDALGRAFLRLMRATYPRADLVVVNSRGLADSLRTDFDVAPDRIQVIYNPFDLDRIARLSVEDGDGPSPPGGLPVIITVGRLEPHKNQAMLLRAFAAVRREIPCHLQLVGDGPMRRRLEALAHWLGVGGDVQFTGWLDNPFPLLRRATAFALTSDFEGFPSALVEAMACGCPVVTTDCPSGPREITLDGTCGLLIPVRDDHALAHALWRLLREPAFARDLGARGAARARDFDMHVVVRDFRDVVGTALQTPGQIG